MPRARWIAPVLDAVGLCVFVAVGRTSHHIGAGVPWFLTVVWPIAAGYFLAALAFRLYTRADRLWWRLAATVVVGVLLGMVLRQVFTGREGFSTFTIVALCFIALVTFGWRLVAVGIARLRAGSRQERRRPRTVVR